MLTGTVTGILSGIGSGGGTLLIIFLTVFKKLPQLEAQGINLLYFLSCGLPAAYMHKRNGQVNAKYALSAIISGCIAAGAASAAANRVETQLVKRLFSVLLILLGTKELFTTTRHDSKLRGIMLDRGYSRENRDNSAK